MGTEEEDLTNEETSNQRERDVKEQIERQRHDGSRLPQFGASRTSENIGGKSVSRDPATRFAGLVRT